MTRPRRPFGANHPGRLPATMMKVLAAEMSRMKVARESRGFTATGLRAWPVLSKSLGALFLRSYERGERVHLAMLSRGYDGKLPS